MNKERYNQIIDSTYKSYLRKAKNQTTEDLFGSMIKGDEIIHGMLEAHTRDFIPYTREEFINKIKTDKEFSERWGLKIEERELSLEERVDYFNSKMIKEGIRTQIGTVDVDESYWRKALEETNHNIPTREITVTHNNETVEIYE